MKRIVITGATSFIGVHLIQECLKNDYAIVAVVRPGSPKINRLPQASNIQIVECAMEDYGVLDKMIDHADYFYHLAWEGARNPYRNNIGIQKNNYECTIQAFNAANAMKCSLFLGTGSQAEYGEISGLVNENYPCNPNTAYGREKLHAGRELERLAAKTGIRFIWTRIFSIFGEYDYPKTLIMSSIKKMRKNEPIDMTLGTQLWDYLYVKDAARAMLLLGESNCKSGVYNLASGNYRPLKEFIIDLKEIMNSNSALNFGAVPYGEKGPVNLTPDVSKIEQAITWKPQTEFKDGIKNIIFNF